MIDKASERLTVNLHNNGKAELALSKIGKNREERLSPQETAAVRHYAYRLLSRDSMPQRLRFTLAFRTVGEVTCCVADPLKVVVDGKQQPIIPARYFDLDKSVFDKSLSRLFPKRTEVDVGGILLQDISLLLFKHIFNAKQELTGYRFVFKKEVQYHPAPLMEYSCCLPIPGEIKLDGVLPKHATVIGRMENDRFVREDDIWKKLVEVSEFLDTNARVGDGFVALLNGSPGSGKEVFANILHYGGLRGADALFPQHSLGGRTTDDVKAQLVGRITVDGIHVESDIVKATNGTLFLDEAEKIRDSNGHESPRELGNFLLRILEAKKFSPLGSSSLKEVLNVNWIFAGAKLKASDSADHLPRDFRSRLNGEISISSPLDTSSAKDYAVALFIHFTFSSVAKALGYTEICSVAEGTNHRSILARWCLADDSTTTHWKPADHILVVAKSVGEAVNSIKETQAVSARSISRLAERFSQVLVRLGEEAGFDAQKTISEDSGFNNFNKGVLRILKELCPPAPNNANDGVD